MAAGQKQESCSEDGTLISRFTIIILSCVLFGLGLGATFPIRGGVWALVAGTLGLVFHIATSYRNKVNYRLQAQQVRERSERRLEALSSASIDVIEYVA